MSKLLCVLFISGALIACDDSVGGDTPVGALTSGNNSAQIISVSDYEFTFNDEPGVNINFSTRKYGECTVTFAKSSLKSDFQTRAAKSEGGDMDLSCLKGERLYMLDDSKQTFAKMRIETLSDTKATLSLGGDLYAIRDDQRLKVENTILIILDKDLRNLKK